MSEIIIIRREIARVSKGRRIPAVRIQEEIYELNKKLPFHQRIQLIRMTEAEFKKTSIQKIRRGRF